MDPKSELVRVADTLYLVDDGNRKGRGCQIVFLHGLQVHHGQEENAAYLRACWSSRDGCELWPKWLTKSFPSASIYLVKYDSRLYEDDKNSQVDMFITAESILSDFLYAKIGQSSRNPVILVGQDVGGLVIKEICLQASRHEGEEGKRLFSQQVKGIVYYSTPHLGMNMQLGDCKILPKLLKVLTIHNEEISRSNEEFRRLRKKMSWKSMALWASRVGPLNVKEGAARFDVDIFCPIDSSAMDICRPEDRSSSSFGQLEKFIKETLFGNRIASRPRLDFKEDPKYVPLLKTSNKIRSWLADPKRQVIVLVGDAGTGKSGVAKYLALQYYMETGPEAEFWDGVFYVDCGRRANAVPILRRLLRQLKVQESKITTSEDVDFLTHLLKENVQDLSVLMIFDDVNGDDRSSLVEKLVIPIAENVKYLFTSQESRGWHGFDVHKIDRITVAIAEKIIAKKIGLPNDRIPEADKGIVLEIIEATEYHPLSLASVAAAVQPNDKGRVDPSDWKEVKENLLFYLTDERGVDAFGKLYLHRSVFTAMMFAVQVLHRQDKILFEALCILALFEGPFPKKVSLLLLLSTKSTLSKHFIRFMKELESRGLVETVAISAQSHNDPFLYYGDICVSVPSCKMHSLRQQFMLWFLHFEEDVASFRGSSVEFRDSIDAVQQIIYPLLTEASEGPDANTTGASMSAALCILFGAKDIKRKALSRSLKVADLLCPDHIRKANLGMLMMGIEQDSDSTFLLEMQRVAWKYIVKGEIDDVSMAYLIAQPDHGALLFFSLHVTDIPSLWKGERGEGSHEVHKGSTLDWTKQQAFSNRKSVEAVFGLLSSSPSTTQDEFQVQMFALQLLGKLTYENYRHPSSTVLRDIIVADPARVDSIRTILTRLAKYLNASPLVVFGMKNTEGAVLREHVAGFQNHFGGWWFSESTSLEMHFCNSVIRPVQTFLSAVTLLDNYQLLERDEFDEELVLIKSISEPLLCITRIVGQRITRRSSTLHFLASSVLHLMVVIHKCTDKRGKSSMDFMPNALENMVSWFGEGSIYDHLAMNVLMGYFMGSSFTSISHFIPMLTDTIKRGRFSKQILERFLDLFQEWDDMICSADRQDLSEVLFTVLSEINETQGVEGWTELEWKIPTVLLLLGHPLEYRLDSCVGMGAIQFQLRQSMEAESRATILLDGVDSLFDIIQNSRWEPVQVTALKIMVFFLERCPKAGARSIFWRSRAVETLAPLLEEPNEKIQELVLNILLSMPCLEWDTFYRPPDGYSCMRHISSISGVPMHVFRCLKDCNWKAGVFFLRLLAELKEDGVSCLLDIPDLLKDIVCVIREKSWLSKDSQTAVLFLDELVRYDKSHHVCSQLVTVTESTETLVRAGFKWYAYRMVNLYEAVRDIFRSFTLEQVRVILTNPTVKEFMQSMILSLQNSDQSIMEFSCTLHFLALLVKEESGVEHVLSFPGSVEAVVGFLIRTRNEQVESGSCSPIGIQKERRKVVAEAVCNSSAFLHQLVRNTSRQGENRIFRISGFLDLMIDLLDEEQVEQTQVIVMDFLLRLSYDPEQQDKLCEFMENHIFYEKCSKLLLSRLGRRPNVETLIHPLCCLLSLSLGNKVITETVQSLVSRGLRELVTQLKKLDEEPEKQAFLFKLLLDRYAQGWVDGIQIGDYFLGVAEALDRLVFTSVYSQQESLRADAQEILGICVRVLEDGTNPLPIGENQRQEKLQKILQAMPVILDQISVEGHYVFLSFLRQLDVDCRQSSNVILKYPKVVQSLIDLSIQDADHEAKVDALRSLDTLVWCLPSGDSNITGDYIYLLQEFSKGLVSIACGIQVGNSMQIQNVVIVLLQNLIRLTSWEYVDKSTGFLLSRTVRSTIVDDIHVLETLVVLLEGDKPDGFYADVIEILHYAGKVSTRALDHIMQLPRILDKLVEFVCGSDEEAVQGAALGFINALIKWDRCKICAPASHDLLMCLVHVISSKVGEEIASHAVRLLVLCAVQNSKALSYLTGLLEKHIRVVLRVDATVFLMKQMSESARDPEKSLLMSLQTTWVRCFPGEDWENYFPGEGYSNSTHNLDLHVLAGLIWLSEISLRMQLRIAKSLTGIHAAELVVVERGSGDSIVS